MEISRTLEISEIKEIKILQNVRLLHRHDLNPIYSKDNLRVQFAMSGEIRGDITCYLCLDRQELSPAERNYIFPLFVESMNILVGKQISQEKSFTHLRIKLSPPRISMLAQEINTGFKNAIQKYDLELEETTFTVLTEYLLEALN